MQILESYGGKCAMALGNFDGLHKAHTEIIKACKSYAQNHGEKCGVVLFDCHTSAVLGERVGLLTTMEEKLYILEKLGVDFVYIMKFDEKTAGLEWFEFIDHILLKFSVDAFFAGYDYTFGRGAKGNAKALKEQGEEKGFKAFITNCVKEDGEVISSSAIRLLIESGEMERAALLLGRSYFLSGKVVEGLGNGRRSLFPTANISVDKDKLLPPDGVYAGCVVISGKRHLTALNIGKNPTLNAEKRTVEAFILDFDGRLYGTDLKIELIKRIRDEIKFAGIAELKEQIAKDIEDIRKIDV